MFERRPKAMRIAAPVTTWLLIANVAIAALMYFSGANLDALFFRWGLVPARLTQGTHLGELATIVSSMFLHAGVWHLLGNMIFLAVFGRLSEELLGSGKFASLYLLAGLGAAVAQIVAAPDSMIPMVGASGAISGTLGAAVVLRPKKRIMLITPFTLFIPISLSIWAFAVLWLGLQFFGGLEADAFSGGIAFWAHIGGFVVGYQQTRRHKRIAREATHRSAPASAGEVYTVTDRHGRTFVFKEPLH